MFKRLKSLKDKTVSQLTRITYFWRKPFVASIPKGVSILEIGPFYSPICVGNNVKYFDILNRESLIKRAKQIDESINSERIPYIEYVSPIGDLSIINETFDIVVSSHAIEHQLDLIDHLQNASKLLKAGGKYYIIVPDKRYCFDHFMNASTIADVINAHVVKPTKTSVKSVIEHRALHTHNNAFKHWTGIHKHKNDISSQIKDALTEYTESDYVDVHSWYFTPKSFSKIIMLLHHLGYIDFTIGKLYPTSPGSLEFYTVLEKEGNVK